MSELTNTTLGRRQFLKTTAAATAGLTIVRASAVAGTEANSKIELGLIGAGNRGVWLGDLAHKNTGIQVVAIADVFDDRIEKGKAALGIDPARCHQGLDAYQKLIESKVDAIAVETPAYFHPEQALAGALAGKHVFLAKPAAIDVPGCQIVQQAGRQAQANKRSFWVDFQTRCTPAFLEAAKRVGDGAIGQPICAQVYYHADRLGLLGDPADTSDAGRLRNWFFYKDLSGDFIVEQSVHVLDVANWYLKSRPAKATGTGGRKARTNVGDCWDHFVVTYTYDNGVIVDFSSSQFLVSPCYAALVTRIYGSEATVDAHYNGVVQIVGGKQPFASEPTKGMYTQGAITNLQSFEKAIRADEPINNAEESVTSSLTTILGRMAAYGERTVTWEEMLTDDFRYTVDLNI